MKYLQFTTILALSLGSALSASAAEVHTDQYVNETLGTEILPSSGADPNLNQAGVNSLSSSVALDSFDYESPPIAFEDSASINSQDLISADSGESPELYENPFGLEIPAIIDPFSLVTKSIVMCSGT